MGPRSFARRSGRAPRSTRRRRGLAGVRQLVEPGDEKSPHPGGLHRERRHGLTGLQARLAAKMARHPLGLWCKGQVGRPNLAFADLVDW